MLSPQPKQTLIQPALDLDARADADHRHIGAARECRPMRPRRTAASEPRKLFKAGKHMETQGLDLASIDYSIIWRALFAPLLYRTGRILLWVLVVTVATLHYALIKYRINLFKLNLETLRTTRIRFKPFNFIRWTIVDLARSKEKGLEFGEYGFTIYCGRQGGGKTSAMVNYLNRMRYKFPNVIIVTNFSYKYADRQMGGWRDLFEIRNGEDGVIFALDEIHSEYSSASYKDFPEELLSEISQQRKQRVKIVATSQSFGRVAKPIREQCASVVQCKTVLNRWTFTREYDAVDYEMHNGSKNRKEKLRSFRRISFVQSDNFRKCFDTYEKIERLKDREFMERDKKGERA